MNDFDDCSPWQYLVPNLEQDSRACRPELMLDPVVPDTITAESFIQHRSHGLFITLPNSLWERVGFFHRHDPIDPAMNSRLQFSFLSE